MNIKRFSSLATVVALAAYGTANAVTVESETSYTFDARDGTLLDLENLAGSVSLVPAGGDKISVIAIVSADDDNEAKAKELADRLIIDVDEGRDRVEIRALYPVDDYRSYTYDQPGVSFNTRTRYQGEKVRVSSRARRSAVRLHADFRIEVPAGIRVDVENLFGSVTADALRADLKVDTNTGTIRVTDSEGYARLDTGSGSVTVVGHRGEVRADTGSGPVSIVDVLGDVEADTGSGSVSIEAVTGNVEADTGSGSVELKDIVGDDIVVDTGSGHVSMDRVRGSLHADTGSGGVVASEYIAGREVEVDTGSGVIRLDGDLSAVRRLDLSAGSGGVTLRMTEAPSMVLAIDTGSGSIDIDVPEARMLRSKRGSMEAELGDGDGRGRIDTGSGSIRVIMN